MSMMYKVATPYAEALLELAQDSNALEKTDQDLSLISTLLSNASDLQSCLSNPLVSVLIKKNILKELLQDQINDFVLKFLLVLVDRRRISLLSLIIEKYLELAYKLKAIIIVNLSTAIAFNESQQNAIINKIKAMTKSKEVKLLTNVDSTLIGGFVIKIGSKVIDTSLAGKLKEVAFYLNKA